MDDVWVGAFALIGLAVLAVLFLCLLRVLNPRAASRESIRRPFDPQQQTLSRQQYQTLARQHLPGPGGGISGAV